MGAKKRRPSRDSPAPVKNFAPQKLNNLLLPNRSNSRSDYSRSHLRSVIMKIETMEDLFLEQVEDLYDAEKRLVKALPKMAEATTSITLRQAFE